MYTLSYIYLSFDSLDLAFDNINEARQRDMMTQQITDLLNEISKKYEAKGDSSFRKHDTEQSGAFFKKATEANDNNTRAWWNYGGICYEKGNIQGAIQAWEKVISLDSTYPKAKEFLSIIKMKNDSIVRKAQ